MGRTNKNNKVNPKKPKEELAPPTRHESERLESLDGFTDFAKRTSHQYAVYWHSDLKGYERLTENIEHKFDWIKDLEDSEKIDFFNGWKRNINYCKIVYEEHVRDFKKFSEENDGDDFYANSLSDWTAHLNDSLRELEFIDSELKHLKENGAKVSKNSNQGLDSNQRLTLLEQLGLFNIDSIAQLPEIKKASLCALITGLNSKNISDHRRKQQDAKKGSKYYKDFLLIRNILEKDYNL